MSMAEMNVVLTGLLLPGIVVLAVVLFALYWVVRKAVRDGMRDAQAVVTQASSGHRTEETVDAGDQR